MAFFNLRPQFLRSFELFDQCHIDNLAKNSEIGKNKSHNMFFHSFLTPDLKNYVFQLYLQIMPEN